MNGKIYGNKENKPQAAKQKSSHKYLTKWLPVALITELGTLKDAD